MAQLLLNINSKLSSVIDQVVRSYEPDTLRVSNHHQRKPSGYSGWHIVWGHLNNQRIKPKRTIEEEDVFNR